ncbi:NepR family anti-sigma factor [Amaricoccus sp. W119]|uniref:NepR family anti-sigma factor n=1 Tax=Amaricoccus sp. W119 TaxID=3391833 RepID=UPI0039A6BB1E
MTKPPRHRGPAEGLLDPHGEIAARLRALYAEVEREPIPAELIDLLERLDEAEAKSALHEK